MANSSMGLTIGISPEMARKLRQHSTITSTEPLADEAEGQSSSLMFPSKPQQPLDSSISAPKALKDDQTLLPCISIHLERLIGYPPTDSDEVEAIRSQLVEAMWKSYQQTSSDGRSISETERLLQPPPDFDRQVLEFFESGVARYLENEESSSSSPSSHQQKNEEEKAALAAETAAATGRLSIRYPAYLQSPVTGERVSTRTIVREIQQKEPVLHSLDFVTKLWKYLRESSMTLFWKRDMATELSLLVREEQARLEYQEWTESTRQSKLDNLYSIRETLVHQVEMAKSKAELLEEERNVKVGESMEPIRRKLQQRQKDSLDVETFRVDSEVVPEPSLVEHLQTAILADSQKEELVQGQVDDNNANNVVLPTEAKDEPEPSLSVPFQRRKDRREKSKRRKRQERKAAEEQARQEHLTKLEAELRSKLTSKELILAQTMHNALADKMTKIEELLDSLQDEVWQAEEELDEQPNNGGNTDASPPSEFAFSLLDQVLAMIFAATPIEEGKSPEEHYNFMQSEHKEIVAAWEAHFGRLPPATVGSSGSGSSMQEEAKKLEQKTMTSKEHRNQLGITENDKDDWEAVENWDDLLDEKKALAGNDEARPELSQLAKHSAKQSKNTIAKSTKSEERAPAPKLVGLRPGGRVVVPSKD